MSLACRCDVERLLAALDEKVAVLTDRAEAAESALAAVADLADWCADKGPAVQAVGVMIRRRAALSSPTTPEETR